MQVARGVHQGANPPGTIMRSGPLRMYFEFLNRTQTLHFGFFGEGECDFERKVAIVEICRLPALSKNPEYDTAGKCASPLSEFSRSTPGNHSLFKEMLQKCTLGPPLIYLEYNFPFLLPSTF